MNTFGFHIQITCIKRSFNKISQMGIEPCAGSKEKMTKRYSQTRA